jgi:hypothetical protein
MIDSVEQDPTPLRIALGGDSYTAIRNALKERLAQLEAHSPTRLISAS